MNFMQQIFKGAVDEKTHKKFIKYGKGEFPGPVLEIKKQGKSIKVKGSFDYSDVLGRLIAGNSSMRFNVSGKILSLSSLDSELSGLNIEVPKTAKKGKLKVYPVKTDADSGILKKLYDLDAYVLLTLSPVEKSVVSMKSKASPPKPGDAVDEGFCSAAFDISMLKSVMDEICFDLDVKEFKTINISHTYIINEMIIPEEFKNNPVEIRVQAKRKGKIIRNINVDGSETIKEGELLA